MKKSLLALAVLGAFAGAASAQSSVTLYGLVDLGLTSDKVNNGDSTKNMKSGLLNGSRWGLRGVEDLGGGMSAVFTLESGFSADTGVGSADGLFNRTSVVGLQGGFGLVNIGRSLTLYDDVRGSFVMERTAFDPTDAVHAEGGGNYVGRYSNRIRYVTPAMGGFVAGAEVSGETAYKSWSGKIGYAAGPLAVWAAMQRDNDAAAPHDSLDHLTLLANYTFGMVTLSGLYTSESNDRTVASDDAKEYGLGAKFQLTPAADVRVAYARSKVDGNSLAAKGFGLEAQYKLSARTKLYAGYRSNKDDALAADGEVAKDKIFGVGLQHRF